MGLTLIMKRKFKGYPKGTVGALEELRLANFRTIFIGDNSTDLTKLTVVGVFLNRIFDSADFVVKFKRERITYVHLDISSPTKDFLNDFDLSVNRTAEGFERKSYLSFSRNFERNTLASPLLQISFAVQEVAKVLRTSRQFVIVTDSKLFSEVICHMFKTSITRRSAAVTHEFTKFFKVLSKIFVSFFWFTVNRLLSFGIGFNRKNLVLINTYLSEEQKVSSFFRDRYFPDLFERLIDTHEDTCYILSGYRWFPRKFVSRFSDLQTFIPEFKYYKFTDFFKAMRMTFDFGQISKNSFSINGVDLTYLWMRLAEIQVANWESCHFALRTRLMTNLERRGVNVGVLITEYEGMIPEKTLALSLKETKMRGSHVAVQHNHMTTQLRSFYPLVMDKALGYIPNYIIFMGLGYLNEFRNRYPNLTVYKCYSGMKISTRDLGLYRDTNTVEKKIMIVGSVREVETLELLQSVNRMYANEGHRLFLMLHPALPRDWRMRILDEAAQSNVEIYSGGFDIALKDFDTFIGSSSGGILKAFFSGKKVIRMATHYCLDIDPFTAISEFLKIDIEVEPSPQNCEDDWRQYCLTDSDFKLLAPNFQEYENSNHDLAVIIKSLM